MYQWASKSYLNLKFRCSFYDFNWLVISILYNLPWLPINKYWTKLSPMEQLLINYQMTHIGVYSLFARVEESVYKKNVFKLCFHKLTSIPFVRYVINLLSSSNSSIVHQFTLKNILLTKTFRPLTRQTYQYQFMIENENFMLNVVKKSETKPTNANYDISHTSHVSWCHDRSLTNTALLFLFLLCIETKRVSFNEPTSEQVISDNELISFIMHTNSEQDYNVCFYELNFIIVMMTPTPKCKKDNKKMFCCSITLWNVSNWDYLVCFKIFYIITADRTLSHTHELRITHSLIYYFTSWSI
jgi:hypothetical protein